MREPPVLAHIYVAVLEGLARSEDEAKITNLGGLHRQKPKDLRSSIAGTTCTP
jgi:hypothetical protein